MKHHSLSKVLKRLACVLAALVIALAVAVFALWHNELATLSSLKSSPTATKPTATVQFTSSTSRAATTSTISWPRAAHPLTLSSSPSSPRASPRASSP